MTVIPTLTRYWYLKIKSIGWHLVRYLHLQLFISLFSMPLLMSWGLPFSLASIVGNYIFVPFLTLFLLLSSLIFFCELLHIPNMLFITILEWLASLWSSLLSLGHRSWLVAVPQPPLIIALLIPVCACAVLHHKKLLSPVINSGALAFMILALGLLLKGGLRSTNAETSIPCFGKEIIILSSQGATACIDPGILGRRLSAPSWVTYTLVPSLLKQGISRLQVLICAQPSTMVFQAAKRLIDTIEVKELYIPAFTGSLKNNGWSSWEKLLASAGKQCTRIHCVGTQSYVIPCGTKTIAIYPDEKLIKKNKLSYHALTITY